MKKSWLLIAAAAAVLAACGGGGNNGELTPVPLPDTVPTVTQAIPADVNVSVATFISYLKSLVVASADTLEPLSTAGVVPATNDQTEPYALD
jgi:hypothetical protein